MGLLDLLLGPDPNKKKSETKKTDKVEEKPKVDDSTKKALELGKQVLAQGQHRFALKVLDITDEELKTLKKSKDKSSDNKEDSKAAIIKLVDALYKDNKTIIDELSTESESSLRAKLLSLGKKERDTFLDRKSNIAKVAFAALFLAKKRSE